ncbi:MAG TPA: GNAT family N-acetyltransferase [Beutenbergiaceae bacterium]|nr:GNAT family N-acetyltransferase [Beutenbergiaceae bacterium]
MPTHAEALSLTRNDPWVRWALPSDPPREMWRTAVSFVVMRRGRRRRNLVVIPLPGAAEPEAAVEETLALIRAGCPLEEMAGWGLTVPQPYLGALERQFPIGAAGDWEWMWTQEAPAPQPGESELIGLDDSADAPEITDLSQAHSPTAEGEPGAGVSEVWLGVRDGSGVLIAAGAMQRLPSGVPYLAGIVVHADHRGKGWGTAVSAGLTRIGLADSDVCTLSMYSDNPAARRTYERLGYRTAWAWASRTLQVSG